MYINRFINFDIYLKVQFLVLTFFMDSTSPQKVIFTIYLNIEYSLCNSVGKTFLLHLVLVGEGEGWVDNAATREDVAGCILISKS